ncbi:polyadenylate-binding protein [Reticulomyxa filosa]|uniref:Polyadenylate-binding protein n=1 Tax=Reticulomyxa filosa TaxID=46433 RepID=X6NQL5_RETFI|nr:polyadenylate-binding protein [Reticulomyxa filosa]|eukprot:ETO27989.1 polyadenylate-binding protein [Reticulomyxa filosa]
MWCQRDKQLRESGKGNIFVKNLHDSVDNKTLFDTFSTFGSILSCKIAVDRETGKSRGYGYVHYAQEEDAKKAITGVWFVNGMLISDKQVYAEPFVPRQERIKKAPWTNVYIKRIPSSMTEADLIKFVEEKIGGKVTSAKMWDKPMFGKSACLNLQKHEEASKTVELLNNLEMKDYVDEKENNGKPLKLFVARSQKRSERDRYLKREAYRSRAPSNAQGNNLYVKPLAPHITDEKLREIFAPYGTIGSAKVMRNPETGQSRGFGFVCFERKEDASQALVKLNGSVTEGAKLYVSRAQKKEERQQFLASRARRGTSRRYYGNAQPQQYYPTQAQMGGYYSYPRAGVPPQPQMYPAQFGYHQMSRPYPMPQMPQVPIPMQMGMPMNQPGQFGFAGIRVPSAGFGGMQPNVGMQPQQPSNSAAVAAGAVGSAAMRSGMGSVGATSQGAVGGRGAVGTPGTGAQGLSSGAGMGAPGANYSQPTQGVGAPPVQHNIYPSAGQTGVEPTTQSRPIHSFPSQLSATERETQPLTPQMLNNATAQERKRMIGERLFPKIQEVEPRLAGKITGMLLEMENTELLVLLNNKDQLRKKINEALTVLKEHHKKQSLRNSESQARQRTGSQGNQSATNRPTSASNN